MAFTLSMANQLVRPLCAASELGSKFVNIQATWRQAHQHDEHHWFLNAYWLPVTSPQSTHSDAQHQLQLRPFPIPKRSLVKCVE